MDDLIIRSAQGSDLEEARHWLNQEGGMTHALMDTDTDRPLIDLENPDNCWVAELSGEVVALASFTEDAFRQAHIGFVVKPSRRRQGIAKAFIPRLLEHQDVKRFSKIIGTPGLGNMAVEKILRHAGFRQTGYGEDGQVIYERR